MHKYLITALMYGVLVAAAFAGQSKEAPERDDVPCASHEENVSVMFHYNVRANSFLDAKEKFNKKIQLVEGFAKKNHFKKFEMQNIAYDINAQHLNYEDGDAMDDAFQLRASYQVGSADNAFLLAEFLKKQKLDVALNVYDSRNMPCKN